jgi:arylsulfatase A-like enzyme
MKNFNLLLITIALSTVFSIYGQKANPKKVSEKPNIIFILADDLGIGDVSCYGSDQNKTPIIDQLAKGGIRFTHGYTAPLCGPSRAMILTGRYAFRTGAVNQDMVGEIKPENEVLIPSVLKPAGYTTSLVGKWSQFSKTPGDFGFDDYLTFAGSGDYWSSEKKKSENYIENGINKKLDAQTYMPDLMHDHLVNFIKNNKDKPFFLYYSMVHVHAVIQRTPDSKPGSDLYADNTAYMDKLVGKLLKTLDDLKLRKNNRLYLRKWKKK